MSEKIGLVLEGGGMRGIYTAGVLDYMLEKNIHFDYVIGVSAGSGNAVGYVAKQKGRTKRMILHENAPSYYGLHTLLRTGKLLNLNTLVRRYAEREIPFDFDTFMENDTACEVVVVNCETGRPEYVNVKNGKDTFYRACMASCSVPFLCKPIPYKGNHYLDGSIVDSIPLKRAFDQGCDKVVVVMTKPEGDGPTDYGKYKYPIGAIYHKYPKLSRALLNRVEEYEVQKAYMDQKVKEGKVLVIRPEIQLMHHFETDIAKMDGVYKTAYNKMKKEYASLEAFLK